MLHRGAASCRLLRPVFLLVFLFALAEPSAWRTGGVLVAAGVASRPLLPTPLRVLVVQHLPRCVSAGMWSVGLLFLHGALDSHPFFPEHAASGRCFLTAAAVCVPAGVVSASAERNSWHTGVVLIGVVVGVRVALRFLLPTPLRTQVVRHMPRRVSMCVRPNTSTPIRCPGGALCLVPPHHCVRGPRVYMARSLMAADGVRSFVVDAGGVCTCQPVPRFGTARGRSPP